MRHYQADAFSSDCAPWVAGTSSHGDSPDFAIGISYSSELSKLIGALMVAHFQEVRVYVLKIRKAWFVRDRYRERERERERESDVHTNKTVWRQSM